MSDASIAAIPLGDLASQLKAAAGASGTVVFEEPTKKPRQSAAATPPPAPTPQITGDELKPVTGMFFGIIMTAFQLTPVPAIQNEQFAFALAPVLNKYAPAVSAYAPEFALLGATAAIVITKGMEYNAKRQDENVEQVGLNLSDQ